MDGGLGQAIDQLLSTDPGSLDDGELHGTVIELECLDSLCAAARARYVGEWDQRRLWSSDGSKSASARLARETRCAPETARLELRRARKLRTMPLTSKAFEHGDITADHVDIIARANRAPITEQFTDGETTLVDAARHEDDFDLFRTIVQQWAHAADDDACDDKAEKAYRGRWFRDNEILDGVHDVQGQFDPLGGVIFSDELHRLEHQLWLDDWAAARAEHGNNATQAHLARTCDQRRADAAVQMACRSAATDANARPPRPLFSVHLNHPTFTGRLCQLANGTPISPASIAPWLTEADIERVIWAGKSRILDIGTRTRFFNGALRRAIELRDHHCTHPGCTVPAAYYQVDHITEYTNGGKTTQQNGRLLCPFHNRMRPGRTTQPPDGP